ncbi:MAG TPA: metal-dependent transcriptional regulator [Anaerolineales bacterium]|nr:metal-dependent transcriptional regulator [Anaerolineales bacterium]
MPRHTPAVEDYLKTVFEIEHEGRVAGTAELAERLRITRASVSGMLKKLAASPDGLVRYTRYHGVRLTAAGRKVALEVIRHHRLVESYLVAALGYGWDEVHGEADHLEHVISEGLEDRIAAYLGNPQADPHGAPIPPRDGNLPRLQDRRLSEVGVGQRARITRVADRDPELLRYLDRLGLRPQRRLRVTERSPFDGPLCVQVDGAEEIYPLSRRVTDEIYVLVDVAD